MTIVRLARPLYLFFAVLTYGLGTAIAKYLAVPISSMAFVLGFAWVSLVQTSMNLLAEVFRPPNESIIPGQYGAERVYLRDRLLFISISLLVLASGCAYLLFLKGKITPSSLLLLGLSLLTAVVYSVPPFKFSRRGYGEILQSIHLGYIISSIGYVLQAGEFHRFIPILGLPITVLALSYFLVENFSTFTEDIKYERPTLLVLLTWQRAIPIHRALIFAALFLFAILPFIGVSPALLWPLFLVLPFAVMEMLLLRNIGFGAHPNWKLVTLAAFTTFALPVYLLAFSFFLR
jgi:1,4-dihydroxy-2-naphthoate octaprenyltransferase